MPFKKKQIAIIAVFGIVVSTLAILVTWNQFTDFGNAEVQNSSDAQAADNYQPLDLKDASTQSNSINNQADTIQDGIQTYDENLTTLSTDFLSAIDAVSAYDAAVRAEIAGHDEFASWAKNQLAGDCSLILWGIGDSASEINAWVHEKLQEKCSSYDQSMLEDARDSMGFRGPERNPALESPDSNDVIFDAIRDAKTPYQLSAAVASYFQNSQDAVILSLRSDDKANVNLGVDFLTRCAKFSGCGPNSFTLLGLCNSGGLCVEGWGVHDLLENTLSPIQMEYARQISDMLLGL